MAGRGSQAARAVGRAIKGLSLPSEKDIPWWRVVASDGRCVLFLAFQSSSLVLR
jgi:alkylated DNA nucleotide flippase Atl1